MHGAAKIRTSVPRCGRTLKMGTKTRRERVDEFHPGEGAHIKIQSRQNRRLDVERTLTVIGGRTDQGKETEVKLGGGSRRLQHAA